jgi:hypothetical protein
MQKDDGKGRGGNRREVETGNGNEKMDILSALGTKDETFTCNLLKLTYDLESSIDWLIDPAHQTHHPSLNIILTYLSLYHPHISLSLYTILTSPSPSLSLSADLESRPDATTIPKPQS